MNIPKITNAVVQCNKIVINVLLFMKLYLLDYYETHDVANRMRQETIDKLLTIIGDREEVEIR